MSNGVQRLGVLKSTPLTICEPELNRIAGASCTTNNGDLMISGGMISHKIGFLGDHVGLRPNGSQRGLTLGTVSRSRHYKPRFLHTCNIIGDEIWIFGGIGEGGESPSTKSQYGYLPDLTIVARDATQVYRRRKADHRAGHTAVLLPQNEGIIVFGGWGLQITSNNSTNEHKVVESIASDMLVIKTTINEKKQKSEKITFLPIPSNGPRPRFLHSAIMRESEGNSFMIVYGGTARRPSDDSQVPEKCFEHGDWIILSDLWQFSFSTKTWSLVIPLNADTVPALTGHVAKLVPKQNIMIVSGGIPAAENSCLYMFDFGSEIWREIHIGESLLESGMRIMHSMFILRQDKDLHSKLKIKKKTDEHLSTPSTQPTAATQTTRIHTNSTYVGMLREHDLEDDSSKRISILIFGGLLVSPDDDFGLIGIGLGESPVNYFDHNKGRKSQRRHGIQHVGDTVGFIIGQRTTTNRIAERLFSAQVESSIANHAITSDIHQSPLYSGQNNLTFSDSEFIDLLRQVFHQAAQGRQYTSHRQICITVMNCYPDSVELQCLRRQLWEKLNASIVTWEKIKREVDVFTSYTGQSSSVTLLCEQVLREMFTTASEGKSQTTHISLCEISKEYNNDPYVADVIRMLREDIWEKEDSKRVTWTKLRREIYDILSKKGCDRLYNSFTQKNSFDTEKECYDALHNLFNIAAQGPSGSLWSSRAGNLRTSHVKMSEVLSNEEYKFPYNKTLISMKKDVWSRRSKPSLTWEEAKKELAEYLTLKDVKTNQKTSAVITSINETNHRLHYKAIRDQKEAKHYLQKRYFPEAKKRKYKRASKKKVKQQTAEFANRFYYLPVAAKKHIKSLVTLDATDRDQALALTDVSLRLDAPTLASVSDKNGLVNLQQQPLISSISDDTLESSPRVLVMPTELKKGSSVLKPIPSSPTSHADIITEVTAKLRAVESTSQTETMINNNNNKYVLSPTSTFKARLLRTLSDVTTQDLVTVNANDNISSCHSNAATNQSFLSSRENDDGEGEIENN